MGENSLPCRTWYYAVNICLQLNLKTKCWTYITEVLYKEVQMTDSDKERFEESRDKKNSNKKKLKDAMALKKTLQYLCQCEELFEYDEFILTTIHSFQANVQKDIVELTPPIQMDIKIAA